jgi:hypothetical protein
VREPERIGLAAFIEHWPELPKQPLLVEFEPLHADVGTTFSIVRRHAHDGRDKQYLNSRDLSARELIVAGAELSTACDASSVLEVHSGTWLSWPNMVSEFHRDWNLWSVLNFMFCGRKEWHVVDCTAVRPHHANLVLRGSERLCRKIDEGRVGYRFMQGPNECVYLPGGYYHRVRTLAFSLNFSLWVTPRGRLFEQRHFTDTWWLGLMRGQHLLKPECARIVEAAYLRRPALERRFCANVYDRYLRACQRVLAGQLSRYWEASGQEAARMRRLLECETFEAAKQMADSN